MRLLQSLAHSCGLTLTSRTIHGNRSLKKLLAGGDTISGVLRPEEMAAAVSVGGLRGIGCHVLYSPATRGRRRYCRWRDGYPAVSGRGWNAFP